MWGSKGSRSDSGRSRNRSRGRSGNSGDTAPSGLKGHIKQTVKDKLGGEHRCQNHPCNELSMGSPIRTTGGAYMHYCGKHKVAGGGTKPVNVLAAAEKKAAAEARRAEREANKPPEKSASKKSDGS